MFNFADFVINEEVYGELNKDLPHMHIAFGVDHWFVPPMGIMMESLLNNNKHLNISFHVFLTSMEEIDKDKLIRLSQKYENAIIKLYTVSIELYVGIKSPIQYYLTTASLHRFIAMSYLYPKVDKILYIDADTCCVAPIDELLNMQLGNCVFAAVEDGEDIAAARKKALALDERQLYYNSGVIWADLRKWNENNVSEKCMRLMMEREDLIYADQDAINVVAGMYGKVIPSRYNYFGSLPNREEDTVIIHYRSGKPWHPWFEGGLKTVWQEYKNRSLWFDWLFVPRNYREYRLMAKWSWKNKDYISSMKWYAGYIYRKVSC
ncbi:glycosyltransferase family 8 protein [Selenomonas ruminantium]|uniref:glycosyltransferase family 8 protein n=1 Tax=Selenomonas ruminantium TaxID=971 RepID=UPI00156886E4|nr:glycosyltransferase [Selenomonas ruminantium]